MKKIQNVDPYLLQAKIVESSEGVVNNPKSYINNPWHVTYIVTIGNMNQISHTRYALNKILHLPVNPTAKIGYDFFLTAHSPSFKLGEVFRDPTNPNYQGYEQELFDNNAVIQFLENKINSIGTVNLSELGTKLSEFLDIHEWEDGV